MDKMNSRLLTSNCRWMLAILILLNVATVFCQFAGGDGTEQEPWQIARAGDLSQMRNYLGAEHADKYYIQTHDIDLGEAPWNEGEGWEPLSLTSDTPFQGHFNGDNYEIRNLTINRNSSAQSLMGIVIGGTFENIRLVDVNIRALSWGNNASLIGTADGGTVIRNCSATGNVVGDTTGNNGWQIGGLVGFLVNSRMSECFADVNVTGRTRCGGLVAWVNASQVVNSYATGTVNNAREVAGGLVGLLMTWGTGQGNGSITNCYATGEVIAGSNQVGGLVGTVGTASISHCYATGQVRGTGGGLVGQCGDNQVTNSYWDTETTGKDASAGGGEGRLTRQMAYPCDLNETYVRWDFDEVWRLDEGYVPDREPGVNNGYPYLYFQSAEQPIPLDTPIVKIDIVEDEENNVIRLRWDPVEDAVSYKIYSSENSALEPGEWGDPVEITTRTEYRGELGSRRFYYVVASAEDPN